MQRLMDGILKSLAGAVIVLSIYLIMLIAAPFYIEAQATGLQTSTIIEELGSPGPPKGWHPPLRL